HRAARVNEGGAVNAFHLQAVSDVDAGRADRDTLAAINAIAKASGHAMSQRLAATQVTAFLAALKIVGDDHRVVVEHRRLEASIRADEGAGLFPKTREEGEEHQREQEHERQARKMIARIVD